MEIEDNNLRRLLDTGRQLLSELDPDVVLERILDQARLITGARYAALGVLDVNDRAELSRFLTVGIDAATHATIGALPRGRGVLGALITDPAPLRLDDVSGHPQSFGFPPGHPPMHTFLGVPIVIRGRAWGNLYLTEKRDGEQFTRQDEDAAVILAQFAATAIENARLYQAAERGRQQLLQAVRGLEASRNIADAIAAEIDLDRILELVVKRGRALVGAQTVLILLRHGGELVATAGAGTAADHLGGSVPLHGSVCGGVLARGRPERILDVQTNLPSAREHFGMTDARTALIVPMSHRGDGLGVLIAYDRGAERAPFTAQDEELLRTFAASAANAVAISRSVEADRLRATIESAEAERRRWARELHDQTLQSLGALRVLLAGAARRGDQESLREAALSAIADLDAEIDNLRGIISDLRPSLLDDLGLQAALEALIERRRSEGLDIAATIALPADGVTGAELSPELETTIYRLVQEALTNIVKHAKASRVEVTVRVENGLAAIRVTDDGVGFDTREASAGFGLAGMQERAYLAGGKVSLTAGAEGTELAAEFPAGFATPSGVEDAVMPAGPRA